MRKNTILNLISILVVLVNVISPASARVATSQDSQLALVATQNVADTNVISLPQESKSPS